jgi:hypothetical protein
MSIGAAGGGFLEFSGQGPTRWLKCGIGYECKFRFIEFRGSFQWHIRKDKVLRETAETAILSLEA